MLQYNYSPSTIEGTTMLWSIFVAGQRAARNRGQTPLFEPYVLTYEVTPLPTERQLKLLHAALAARFVPSLDVAVRRSAGTDPLPNAEVRRGKLQVTHVTILDNPKERKLNKSVVEPTTAVLRLSRIFRELRLVHVRATESS